MSIVDVVDGDFCLWVGKVELLAYGVTFFNVLGSLDLHVKLISIHGVGNSISKELDFLDPREISATEY